MTYHERWVKKLEGTGFTLLSHLEHSKQRVKVRAECGHTFHMAYIQSLQVKINLKQRECESCLLKKKNKKLSLGVYKIDKFIRSETNQEYKLVSTSYRNNRTPITIKHKTCGEEFNMTFSNFQRGSRCPICSTRTRDSNISSYIKMLLKQLKFDIEEEKSFEDCKNPLTGSKLFFDIYIEDLNTVIEIDGEQHFTPIEFFGGEEALIDSKWRDYIKDKFCYENNINIVRLALWDQNKKSYERLKFEALFLIKKLVQARKKIRRHL